MSTRRFVVVFALAFSLGTLGTAYVLRPQDDSGETSAVGVPAAAAPANVPDADADAPDESGDAKWPDDAGSPEQVMYSQAQLMDAAVAKLAPRTPGKTNLYVVAFAGDGAENVFRNEAEYVEKLFSERYDALGHTLVLINNPATLTQRPLASLSNLQTAIDAMATRMDPEDDVLLVFLTSHGSPEHELAVELDPLPLDQIAPDDLADVFSDTKIRNKVVVISACYSGGFIDALKGPGTMVITAARADRASFGCGTQSAITDFGRAFLSNGLNDRDTLPAAFAEARKLVYDWETKAGEEHSEPQIATATPIETRLKSWRDGIHLGPPVPFETTVRGHARGGGAPTLTARR